MLCEDVVEATRNEIYCADNLAVLRGLPASSVDLIATDPPFNKGKVFQAHLDTESEGAEFGDSWVWDDAVHGAWLGSVGASWPAVRVVVDAARVVHGDGMAAFLVFMCERLVELHRVLKPTGSLYLHCDETASHCLKWLLDAVFGRRNFVNEVTWRRSNGMGGVTRKFPVCTDSIFLYVKGPGYVFHPRFTAYGRKSLASYSQVDEDGRRYRLTDLTSPKPGGAATVFEFMGMTPRRGWRWTREHLEQALREGRVVQTAPGVLPRSKRFLDESKGVLVSDIWEDIKVLASTSTERVGYPTQKPVALYRRMVEASSDEGDLVLDPFMGSGTTLLAACGAGRRFLGIDVSEDACRSVLGRLASMGVREEGAGDSTDLFGDVVRFRVGGLG